MTYDWSYSSERIYNLVHFPSVSHMTRIELKQTYVIFKEYYAR